MDFVVVRGSHGGEDFFERVERFVERVENVELVDFVGEEEDVVLVAETDDGSHVVLRKAVPRWVSWVDHDELPTRQKTSESQLVLLLLLRLVLLCSIDE